jgi:hypothetical protein
MTLPTLRSIDQLNTEWKVLGRAAAARTALDRLARAEPGVAQLGFAHLGELTAHLRRASRPEERVAAARLVQAMVRSGACHPLLPRATLQALLPGLVSVARRLSWGGGGDWEDGGAFFAEVVATAWEVIVAWTGQDRPYVVLDLLSAVRCRVRRQLVTQRTQRARLRPGLEGAEQPHPAPDQTGLEQVAVLLDDLSGRGLDRGDAALLYGQVVLGLSLTELARLAGRSRRHLDGRRLRARRALCA